MKNYDNYTFTRMVNVSIRTMGQARALGIEGRLLREFGLSALMHDIGKVGVPEHLLNKPGQLTPEEYLEMQKHPSYGLDVISNAQRDVGAREDQILAMAKDIV